MQARGPDPAVASAARHALSLLPLHDREGVWGLDELDEAYEEEDFDELHRQAQMLEKSELPKGIPRWQLLIAARDGGVMKTSQGGDARKASLVPPIVTPDLSAIAKVSQR
jgi:hypothetical protein